jgi:hypothetical protein
MSKVTTATEVRLSYTNLLTPRAQNAEKPDELTFSTSILIPKSDTATVDAIKKAVAEAAAEGVTKVWDGKRPAGLKNPLRDGDADRPDDENYKGMWFINAKGPRGGKEAPILLDSKGQETAKAEVIYSGVMARVALQFYPYAKQGNKGVAAGISSVLSLEKGEPLGNVVTADSARNEFGIVTPAGAAAAGFASEAAPATEGATTVEDPWGI